jgi:hypothetical protein
MDTIDPRVEKTFDGHSEITVSSAETLRMLLCYYFRKDCLDLEIPVAGDTITRRQVIAMAFAEEANKDPSEVSNDDIEKYIKEMTHAYTWGSMPQIIAFAMMTKCHVRIWQTRNVEDRQELFIIDSVKHREASFTMELLFRCNHYDLMIPDAVFETLKERYPFVEDRVVNLPDVRVILE